MVVLLSPARKRQEGEARRAGSGKLTPPSEARRRSWMAVPEAGSAAEKAVGGSRRHWARASRARRRRWWAKHRLTAVG